MEELFKEKQLNYGCELRSIESRRKEETAPTKKSQAKVEKEKKQC